MLHQRRSLFCGLLPTGLLLLLLILQLQCGVTYGAVPIAAGRRYAGVWPEPMNIPVLIDTVVPQQYVTNIETAITNLNQQLAGGNCIRLTRITARPAPPARRQAPNAAAVAGTTATTNNAAAAAAPLPLAKPGDGSTPPEPSVPFAVDIPTICDAFVGVDVRSQTTPGEQVLTLLWDSTNGRIPCLRDGQANNNVRVIMALMVQSMGLYPELSRDDRLPRVELVIPAPSRAIMELFGDRPDSHGYDMGSFDCNSITMPDPLLYSSDGRTPWWSPRPGACLSTSPTVGTVTRISVRDCIGLALLMHRRSQGCGTNLDEILAKCQSALTSTP